MTTDPSSIDPDRNPLDVLADEFAARCRRGDTPSIVEYTERHPELAEQIERLFPSIAMMERLGKQEQSSRKAAQTHAAFANRSIERVGDFRVVREIGRGGMGIVYEAIQESLERRVAVKVLSHALILDEKHLNRFRREARTAARLHHTNIVPVFGVGESDGLHYYVMQLIRGAGLDEVIAALRASEGGLASEADSNDGPRVVDSQHLRRVIDALDEGVLLKPREPGSTQVIRRTGSGDQAQAQTLAGADTVEGAEDSASDQVDEGDDTAPTNTRPLTRRLGLEYWRSVARIGLQIADALRYAHRQGTLHRDIKPGNLLLDTNGVVWVADFGLAKALEHDDVSRTGDVVGTLRYMSPEQFAGQADHRSDIYSLGLTLYELLTLQPAYRESDRSHLLPEPSEESKLAPPRQLHPQLPADLETIVMKACAQRPADRYQSADEVVADLRCYLDFRPIASRRPSPWERLTVWTQRNPAVAALAAFAIVLILLVALSTSIGYVNTRAALARESAERTRAEEAQAKAEATLGISLDVLDRIYQRFAPDRMVEATQLTVEDEDGLAVEIPAQPALSRETAALLDDILKFYDRFAQQDGDNLELREQSALANRRVGDIHQRLGDYSEAESAYQRAIEKYLAIEKEFDLDRNYAGELARLLNSLGNVYSRSQRPAEAKASYQDAIDLLESNQSSTPELRYELARSLYFMAKRPSADPIGDTIPGGRGGAREGRPPRRPPGPREYGAPPGRGGPPRDFSGPGGRGDEFRRGRGGRGPEGRYEPPGSHDRQETDQRPPGEYLDRAIDLLVELDAESDGKEAYRYLLSLCYRERSQDLQSRDWKKSIELLEDLCEKHPGIGDFRFALSETYAALDPRQLRPIELSEAETRLRTSIEYADQLAREHPNLPEYAHARAHTYHKLANVLDRQSWRAAVGEIAPLRRESELLANTAIDIQSSLVDTFPNVTLYRFWLTRMHKALAGYLVQRDRWADASAELVEAIALLSDFDEGDSELWFVHMELHDCHRFLAEVWEHLGEPELAAVSRSQSDHHRRLAPRPRPRR